ncbi:general odorant-binding protein 99a-like [Episyrphus balteatus]|uniref:general odorant-binding protein 99a-like n=1 Tax=Episyrphus balteatus TaxID=286459 RepID=UPI00248567EB|nr:general odorant-binding protein 99a-like [Episyrphus balteatus]
MKTFLVVLAFIGAVLAEEWEPKKLNEMNEIRRECLVSNPLSVIQLAAMKKFVYLDEEQVRKYLLCDVKKLEIFDEREGWYADRIVKQLKMRLDEAEATKIVEVCVDKNEQKSSADVWVYRGHKCVMASKIGDEIKELMKKQIA